MGWDELGKMAENCNSGDGCSANVNGHLVCKALK